MHPDKSIMQIRRLTLAIALSVGLTGSVALAAESLGRNLTVLSVEAAPEPVPPSEEAAQQLHELLALGSANPTHFAYPWIDPATGEAVADVTSDMGAQLARAFQPDAKSTRVAYRVRTVRHAWAEFEHIRDDVAQTMMKIRDPEFMAIEEINPDPQNNRLILTVDRLSNKLLDTLAARYGTDAIAVRYDPKYQRKSLQARQNDDTPFWGGANINGNCTNAFAWSWYDTAQRYGMLTAGHCIEYGGEVYTPVRSQGYVTENSRENWLTGHGSTWLTGQTVNRGDMALIQLDEYRTAQPWIYRGSRTSGTGAAVHEMWSREAAVGDQYCTGGQVTGELCGWRVTQVRYDQALYRPDGKTFEGLNRDTNAGMKSGTCSTFGDSGGPVYTVRSDGRIAAKGINSWGGSGSSGCTEGFTDIWQAFYGFPGILFTQ
jgi:Trypsin